jgi:hypothetical protein
VPEIRNVFSAKVLYAFLSQVQSISTSFFEDHIPQRPKIYKCRASFLCNFLHSLGFVGFGYDKSCLESRWLSMDWQKEMNVQMRAVKTTVKPWFLGSTHTWITVRDLCLFNDVWGVMVLRDASQRRFHRSPYDYWLQIGRRLCLFVWRRS